MADVSHSIPLPKRLSNPTDFNSKHIYDDVLSTPTPKNLNAPSYSVRFEDYREIFSPSEASLGSPILILDLPPVDRTFIVRRGRSSGVDYAGVFSGAGQDDRILVLDEEMVRNAKNDAQPSRSSTQIKIPASKSQEFICDSGDCQESKTPAKTRVTFSKSQEAFGTSGDNKESSSASIRQQFDSGKTVNVTHKKTNQLSKDDAAGKTHIPHLHAASKNPAKTRVALSKSQEFCGSSRDNQTSSSVSTHQQLHSLKHFDVSHQKANQLSEDDAAEMTHITTKNTHMFNEVCPARKYDLDKEKQVSMDDDDFSMKVGKGKRVVSDLSTDKKINDHDAQLQKEFGRSERDAFDATRSTREANRKLQTFSVPQVFDSNEYFRMSSSQRSKSSTNNLHGHAAAGSSSPLLEKELDVNSVAAVSAAAMKRTIQEAEAKIHWAKEFLKGQEGDGSTKLTFKQTLKVKTTSEPNHANDTCGQKQNDTSEVQARRQKITVDNDKLLKRKSRSNATATSENSNFNKIGGSKSKDDLNLRAMTESQIADEAGVLNEKLHGVPAEEFTATKDSVGFRSTCPAETFEEIRDSLDQAVCVNDAELREKTYPPDVPKSTESGDKCEGGEWEATKHLSQLFSDVKNRLVSFISKQADTEKIVIQEDIPSLRGAVEQSEGSTYQVQHAETHINRAPEKNHLEKEVKMNVNTTSGAEEIAQDSDGTDMEIHKPEENEVKITVALEQEKVEDITSPDIEMLISEQCDPSEPEQKLDQIEVQESIEVKGELIQEDIHEQGQEILEDYVGWGCEKGQVGTDERVELDMTHEATYQSSGYDSKEDQEPVVKGVGESFDGKDGTRRQEEACNWREMEVPEDSRKKLEDVEMVEETCTDELQERVLEAKLCTREDVKVIEHQVIKRKLTVGLIEVADDTSEHVAVAREVSENDESLVFSKDEEVCLHDERSEYAQQLKYSSGGEGMVEESATSPSEPKMNLEQAVAQLVGEDMCEQRPCTVEVADDVLKHDICFPATGQICQQEQSCLRRNEEPRGCDDTDQSPQDVDFNTIEKESMAESTSTTSETEGNREQPSSVHTISDLIGEEMNETSVSARNWEDIDIFEEEIKDASEDLSRTNIQKNQCETDMDLEQKHAHEETFATDTGSENQGDDSEVRTDIEVDMASDQDTKMHDADISCKRKRWLENKDEAEEFRQPGVLLGVEITQELEEEVDENVNGSGEGIEATHGRRRWFENRGHQEVLDNPSVFDGARMTTQMDDQITQELELDDSLQNCADKLGKEGTDVREHGVASDHVESRATAEAAHRRRRWFDNGERLGPTQRPSYREEDGIKTEIGEDTAKYNDGLDETSTSGIMENKHQNQLNNREREKERERVAVDRAIREARQRAFAEAKERAAIETRQKAAAAAQARQGKDSSEAKFWPDKAFMDAKLKAERAAVERATVEARERALQRAMSEKTAYKSKEKDSKNQTSGSSFNSGYSSAPFSTEKSSGSVNESPQRRKSISERNRRTMEREANALEEKNMRDFLVQNEQAERNRFADALAIDFKRWLTGKEGNLPAMLSTLQYILGPDSGWQPIPLTDLVTSTAIRKAYKRAALCVHPDKLQQRGATTQQKYICEKVFDILKDAWNKFNPNDS